MTVWTVRVAPDRSRSAPSHPWQMRAAAIAGVIGSGIQLLVGDAFARIGRSIFGYPEYGVGAAAVETLAVTLIAVALFTAYGSIAHRRIAVRTGAVALGVSLAPAFGGVAIASDGAIVGSILLALGLAIALARGGSAVGWLGVLAGSLVLATALPASGLEPARLAREATQVAAVATGAFVLGVSFLLWRRADVLSTAQRGVIR